jgi:hypothetical protein
VAAKEYDVVVTEYNQHPETVILELNLFLNDDTLWFNGEVLLTMIGT